MAVTVVVGAQWGDEGKGRIVDWLAQQADLVIRFQGGDNAGHTVINAAGRFALHIIPSGIFNPAAVCIIGAGTVVDPGGLLNEIGILEAAGVSTAGLLVDERATLVLAEHRQLDALQEDARAGQARIGTTRRGIGPAYADKASRTGLRMGDLTRPATLAGKLARCLERLRPQILALGGQPAPLDERLAELSAWGDALGARIVDTLPRVHAANDAGRAILLEGQLGALRDLDWGTWPHVTSSHPIAGAAAVGAGLPPQAIDRVVGVVKAYTTAVGAGPMPTELLGAEGDRLRDVGAEYGATTGRPRRCGWFDAVAVRHAARLNGFTHLALTKLDVLDAFAEIPVGVGYRLDGEAIDRVPWPEDHARAAPILETAPGWQAPTTAARHLDELPAGARAYVERLERLCGGAPAAFISVGPARDQLIVRGW
ncbi:MAG: adenylosuccinate synthase [Myxococcales bacterium]|nr:adenylosuccinate synthase [Myxococcales bacterium]